MDRYVIKEKRSGVEYPQGNQMVAFSANGTIGNHITIPMSPNLYYGAFDLPGVQNTGAGFVNVNMNTPRLGQSNMIQNPGQIISGIDPCYLAAYCSDNITPTAGPPEQHIHQDQSIPPGNVSFGSNYENRNLNLVEKALTKPFPQQRYPQTLHGTPVTENMRFEAQKYANFRYDRNETDQSSVQQPTPTVSATTQKQSEVNLLKNEAQYQVRTRSDKLKVLHKSGPRAFSGPVEKVLKWHKSLQDIGLLVFYEIVAKCSCFRPGDRWPLCQEYCTLDDNGATMLIVYYKVAFCAGAISKLIVMVMTNNFPAKCVSVRPGERCAKNIVVRDDNGPAMQVVYYEVDFFLPELKPPCTIRVIGRMMPGTCRLQAFNVRVATGDDVSTLPRRAAVAAHHVAKLCKEYGRNSEKTATITS